MSIFTYILLSLAVALISMVALRRSAEVYPVRLTKGLVVSLVVAASYCVLLSLGVLVANIMPHFEYPDVNNMVFVGIALMVAFRLLLNAFGKMESAPAFDLSRWVYVLSLSVATGLNLMMLGLGIGFKTSLVADSLKMLIPTFIATFLLSYLGVMMGRQKVKFRQRRWLLFAVLFLSVFTLKVALDY